jgi:hypothetical protein
MIIRRTKIWESRDGATFLTCSAKAIVNALAGPGFGGRIVDTFDLVVSRDDGPDVRTAIAVFRYAEPEPVALIEPDSPRQVEEFIHRHFDRHGKLIKKNAV